MPATRRKTASSAQGSNGPFKCPQCDTYTTRKADLKRHEQIHSDAKHKCPHRAEGCMFSTRQKSNLKTHLAQHDPSLQQQCPECEFRCNDQSSLIRHRKFKHGYVPKPQASPVRPLRFLPPTVPDVAGSTRAFSDSHGAERSPRIDRAAVVDRSHPSSAFHQTSRPSKHDKPAHTGNFDAPAAPATPPPPYDCSDQLPLEKLHYPLVEYPYHSEDPSRLESLWQTPHSGRPDFSQEPRNLIGSRMGMNFANSEVVAAGNFGQGMASNLMMGMGMDVNGHLASITLVPALSTMSTQGGYSLPYGYSNPVTGSTVEAVPTSTNEIQRYF
ncbi:hypothetical protein DFH05DRAFT_1529467 [Lentinula detonsa]|uniref:C2H2-type domain-containing protein n=1 Tax=Lentinula detonsa TaxID=2804962 RepID=A0A9W8TU89_9AGAR|nr:hypothetical protein DFH05DRAFT_1529467 [Lentinula detonsa]